MKKNKSIAKKNRSQKRLPNLKSIYLVVFAFLVMTLPVQNVYSQKQYSIDIEPRKEIPLPTVWPLPKHDTSNPPPELTAQGIVIVDIPSGTMLLEKNPELRMYPASTTKVMTAIVALEKYQLEDVVEVKTVITEGQVMHLVGGEKITVENLLYGILVHSANDAAYALAEHHPQGYDGFIKDMNDKAASLHLTNTHFDNPIGFDSENHYTTPRDLARLSLIALQNPIIHKIAGVTQITVSDTDYAHFHPLKNINELIGTLPGVSGLKTGFTQAAGQSLIAAAQRNDRHILVVVLKSEDRFGETARLIEWVFGNFEWTDLNPKK